MRIVEDVHGARALPRYKLFQPTEIDHEGATARVHLLNLSAGGALVYAAAPPRAGSVIGLVVGGRRRSAQVAWATDKRFGVRFAQPLTHDQLARIIADQDALVSTMARRLPPIAA